MFDQQREKTAESFQVIVVGGGPAGVTAALRASELGAKVALVERGRLGGTCTNDGCIPTRVLAKAARLARDAQQFESYGLEGGLPEINFRKLLARTQQTVYKIHEKKQIGDHLIQAGIKLFTHAGSARFLDDHTLKLGDGTQLIGEKIILCVGGHARRFAFPGSEYALTHHDVWTLTHLPKTIAIVGGAATGSQLASIFAAFGSQVWLFERNSRILGVEDELLSEEMTRAFRDRNIEVAAGIGGIERIEKLDDGRLEFWYTYQDEAKSLPVEAVILAVGWAGNVEDLNLEAVQVHTERSYVVVNEHLQSSVPHIFAAGDITGRMMLVQSGGIEGRTAAENAVLGVGQRNSHQVVPHGGFTDPEYASVGLTESQARALEPDCIVEVVRFNEMDRAVVDDHAEGFCKLIVSQENHRILGAHIVGEQALEIIQLVAAGMTADMWVEQLAEMELAYPTYTAVVGLAARRAVRSLGIVPLSPEWRSLGRLTSAEWERSAI